MLILFLPFAASSLVSYRALSGRDFNGGFVISVNDPLTAHLALFDNISGIVFHVRDGVRAHVGQQQVGYDHHNILSH